MLSSAMISFNPQWPTCYIPFRDDEISDPVKFPERERRFLGCIRMPLSAVYQMQVSMKAVKATGHEVCCFWDAAYIWSTWISSQCRSLHLSGSRRYL
jgi:hypothetical protein